MPILVMKTKDGFVPAEKTAKGFKPIKGAKLSYTGEKIEVVKTGKEEVVKLKVKKEE